jgi:hypothetical protein
LKLLFLPGDIVQPNDSWYEGQVRVPKHRPRYMVSGYSDDMLRAKNPVVTLKRTSKKSGKTYYDTFHQDWLELVKAVKR